MNYNEHYKLLKELNEKVKGLNKCGKILNIFIYGNSCMTLLHGKDFNADCIDAIIEVNSIKEYNEIDELIKEIFQEQKLERRWMSILRAAPLGMSPSFGYVRVLEEFEYLNIYCLDKRSFLVSKIGLDTLYDKKECLITKSLMEDVSIDYREYIKDLVGRYYDIRRLHHNVDIIIDAVCKAVEKIDKEALV